MKRAALLLLVFTLGVAATLAWADIPMIADNAVPAATGGVSLDQDKNGNTTMSVHVQHLARPAALTPPADYYAVWVQAPGQDAKYIGNLAVDKDLKGELRSVVPYKAFDVFVTAESNPRPETPSGLRVLHATVQSDKSADK